ncbi:L,D-transpeptidase [Butyrivibrio sp. MC2013]|uniref:L,D-transpeptidase n=1 Tax=Butyrivibrio sp. MC2013 TaxID=1280686 RepID=UPI0003F96920|nr:L,D-transpeptidase [Butyrivibrio sp. MC2013]
MKTFFRWIAGIIITSIISAAAVLLLLAAFYSKRFAPGTWYEGHYLTGMTSREAAELLNAEFTPVELTVTAGDGRIYHLTADELSGSGDYYPALERMLENQNIFTGIMGAWKASAYEIAADISVDREAIEESLLAQGFTDIEDSEPSSEFVNVIEDGWTLVDNSKSFPVKDKILDEITLAAARGKSEIDLGSISGCYADAEPTKAMKSMQATYDKIRALEDTGIIYDFGEDKQEIGAAFISECLVTEETPASLTDGEAKGDGLFIAGDKTISFPDGAILENGFYTDEEGHLLISCRKIYEELTAMCSGYNTYNEGHEFKTSDGRQIVVSCGTYGSRIDLDSEYDYLVDALTRGIKGEREPVYDSKAPIAGPSDITDTYVEISIENQHLYYYENGELILDTDVVTGNKARKRDTPTGAFYVYGKARNRYLKGPGYISFVKYWMPVYKGVGIHDASWRKEFGGDIYQTSGSHGCINLPTEMAAELYDLISVGTVVVIY